MNDVYQIASRLTAGTLDYNELPSKGQRPKRYTEKGSGLSKDTKDTTKPNEIIRAATGPYWESCRRTTSDHQGVGLTLVWAQRLDRESPKGSLFFYTLDCAPSAIGDLAEMPRDWGQANATKAQV